MKYVRRIIDQDLDLRVKAFGGINIVGPKGCGKTSTAKERCKTFIEFEDEDKRKGYLEVANTMPSLFLDYPLPILFDEWQDAPSVWGLVRKTSDDTNCFGTFFLTGSSAKKVNTPHSGTTRISTVEMYPMSLYESGESNGKISLKELFDNPGKEISAISPLTLPDLIKATCRGGWPRTLQIKDEAAKMLIAKDYFYQVVNEDISRIDGVKRDPEYTKAILKSYARNIGTLSKKNVLLEDSARSLGFSEDTFDRYVEKLKELYIIKDYDAWNPQIRSEKSLRSPKKHMFIDPSLAIAALEISPLYFSQDLDLFGHIFESLVYRDLTVYSQALHGSLSHYHDMFDLEVDSVLHLGDGRYALIEIKLGTKDIQKGESNLLEVERLIKESNKSHDSLKMRLPDLKIIITAGEFAYTLPSGVKVIPIGCLKD